MNEKAYKTMSRSGAGIIAVVSGARLLHDKKEIMF